MGRGQSRGGGRGRARNTAKGKGGDQGASHRRGGSRGARVGGKVDGKLDSWKTAKDVPMDEEDQFFAARDKILLDDVARARARAGPGIGDGDEFDQDDEVFGLDGVGGSSEDEEDEDEDFDDDPPARIVPKAKAKHVAQAEDSEASSDSEEELSHWGKSRSVYYADDSRVMDEDDAEAREMEEREGRRLQAKMIAEIGEDDWGYNDVHDTQDAADSLSAVPATPPLPTDKASLLRHMEKHDPLALALARDWEDTAYQVMETSAAVKDIETTNPDDPALGLMHLHHQTLLSYATTLAFYLHLQSTPSSIDTSDVVLSPAPLAPAEAKRLRPEVISRLLTLKQALATLEDLGFAVDEGEGDDDDGDDGDSDDFSDEDDMSVDGDTSFQINGDEDSEGSDDVSPYGLRPGERVPHANGGTPRLQNLEEEWQQEKIAGWMGSSVPSKGNSGKKKKEPSPELGALEEGELEALMQDALELEPSTSSPPKKRSRKTDTVESDDKEVKKKKKKKDAAPVFDLVEPEFASAKSKDKKGKQPLVGNPDVDSEAFGDPTQLSHTDASDKAGRRRTLRFHTSKIESASNRRSAARAGMGGDDDLPYRERRKEQKRKGLGEGGDDLEMDGDVGADANISATGKRTRESTSPVSDGEAEGEDGYYDLVRKAKKQRKEEKKAEYESMRAAERIDPDDESAPGPRSLTRAILKNRGMTPNRSPKNKAARNPRVKKKLQYAKAQKKLGSRQAVFKGGEEVAAAREGRYEGEKSGISGRVVKSVKL